MDVKPWEPVMGGYCAFDIWPWEERDYSWIPNSYESVMHLTLANNQRVIVRGLSEDRKVARAAMKEASR